MSGTAPLNVKQKMNRRKVAYYIPLLQCSIASTGKGVKIADGMYLRGDGDTLLGKMSVWFKAFIGRVEVGLIEDHRALAYGDMELNDDDDIDKALFSRMAFLSSFLTALWVLRDNSISFDVGFADERSSRGGVKRVWPDDGYITDANAKRDECTLDERALRQIRVVHQQLFGEIRIDDTRHEVDNRDKHEIVHPDGSRLSRSLYFVNAARRSQYRSTKIAYFCSAFEAILSPSDTEMTHRLCEIVAWLLGDSCGDRIDLYDQMKRAYDIRSKVVHGGKMKKQEIGNLDESVLFCDRTLRRLIGRIAENDALRRAILGPGPKFDNAMKHVIFGGHT